MKNRHIETSDNLMFHIQSKLFVADGQDSPLVMLNNEATNTFINKDDLAYQDDIATLCMQGKQASTFISMNKPTLSGLIKILQEQLETMS